MTPSEILQFQIAALEAQQQRPMRELALGDATAAAARITTINNQIIALRAQLNSLSKTP